jgi:hypothetical protein
MFKLATIFFMILSAVFAGLFFTESEDKEEKIVYIEVDAKKSLQKPQDDSQRETSKLSKTVASNPVKTRVIIQEVNPFENVSKEEAELLLTIRDYHRQDEGRDFKNDNTILFKRLDLDTQTETAFLNIMADKRLANEIRPHNWMTDEEKELAKEKREAINAALDLKAEAILGPQFETYTNYREKSRQYSMVADMDKKLIQSNANFNETQQDQLAEVLYKGKKLTTKFNWKEMKKSPEVMDKWLSFYKDNQATMTSSAEQFLEEPQLEIFQKTLKSYYSRYAGYISHQKKKIKKK